MQRFICQQIKRGITGGLGHNSADSKTPVPIRPGGLALYHNITCILFEQDLSILTKDKQGKPNIHILTKQLCISPIDISLPTYVHKVGIGLD